MADTFWATGLWSTDLWVDGFWTNQGAAPPPSPAPSPTPAGVSRRAPRRLYVEIDGQQFPVASVEEARELLQQARAIAERQAEEKGERATKVLKRKARVPKVVLAQPKIVVSPEIRAAVAPLIESIQGIYSRAAELAELRLLMMQAERIARNEEDDEDELLLLL